MASGLHRSGGVTPTAVFPVSLEGLLSLLIAPQVPQPGDGAFRVLLEEPQAEEPDPAAAALAALFLPVPLPVSLPMQPSPALPDSPAAAVSAPASGSGPESAPPSAPRLPLAAVPVLAPAAAPLFHLLEPEAAVLLPAPQPAAQPRADQPAELAVALRLTEKDPPAPPASPAAIDPPAPPQPARPAVEAAPAPSTEGAPAPSWNPPRSRPPVETPPPERPAAASPRPATPPPRRPVVEPEPSANPVERVETGAARPDAPPPSTPRAVSAPSAAVPAQGPEPPHERSILIARPAPAAEPAPTAPERPVAPAARSLTSQISVSLPSSGPEPQAEQRVALRLIERAQEVHVAVRTSDRQLSQQLRTHLVELADRLDRAGFQSEAWRPAEAGPVPALPALARSTERGFDPPGAGQPRDFGGGRRQQHQPRPRWVEELEKETKR